MKQWSQRRISGWDFLAGAMLASAPMWLLVNALTFWLPDQPSIPRYFILNIGTMGCGALAGTLVARKARSAEQAGVLTGLFAYVLLALYMFLTGFKTDFIEETSALTGYVLGSLMGAKFWERNARASRED